MPPGPDERGVRESTAVGLRIALVQVEDLVEAVTVAEALFGNLPQRVARLDDDPRPRARRRGVGRNLQHPAGPDQAGVGEGAAIGLRTSSVELEEFGRAIAVA